MLLESTRQTRSTLPFDVAADAVGARVRVFLDAGVAALGLALSVPQLLPGVGGSYLLVAAVVMAAGTLIVVAEPGPQRATALSLFVWAFAVRVSALTICQALSPAAGPHLGPDSTTYFQRSVELAAAGFHLDAHPAALFGTYDIGHYYMFAAAVKYLGADLFALQLMNCGLTALAVPLVFSLARSVVPSAALLIGVIIAVHPTVIVLSAVDLLKDSAILFGTVLVMWAVVRSTTSERLPPLVAYALAAAVAAIYIRTSRFYAFAYLELAAAGAVVYMRLIGIRVFRRRVAAVAVLTVFLAAEWLPARAGWPPSPLMVASSVSYVLDTPAMSQYALGFFDRLRLSGGRSGPIAEHRTATPAIHLGPRSGFLAPLGSGLSFAANLFRRLYGPFVWILPGDWRFQTLQAGDYLLYPGTAVWYGLLPFIAVGLGVTGVGMLKRTETRFGIVFLWIFAAVNLAQYLAINLSYRQRDVMLPVVVFFAWAGLVWMRRTEQWRLWYGAYWISLGIIAAGHLLARRLLQS